MNLSLSELIFEVNREEALSGGDFCWGHVGGSRIPSQDRLLGDGANGGSRLPSKEGCMNHNQSLQFKYLTALHDFIIDETVFFFVTPNIRSRIKKRMPYLIP